MEKLDINANYFTGSMPREICNLKENGKLAHLSGEYPVGDTTALDLSSFFGQNRGHCKLRLVNMKSSPFKDDLPVDMQPKIPPLTLPTTKNTSHPKKVAHLPSGDLKSCRRSSKWEH